MITAARIVDEFASWRTLLRSLAVRLRAVADAEHDIDSEEADPLRKPAVKLYSESRFRSNAPSRLATNLFTHER